MRILVLGGTAFLSSEVARQAVAAGHQVKCLARGSAAEPPAGVQWVQADRSLGANSYREVAGDWDAVHQRILRDWLRSHPDDADLYVHAKCDAVAAAARGTSEYNAAKTPVIQEIVDRAPAAQGLPSVPVSDK